MAEKVGAVLTEGSYFKHTDDEIIDENDHLIIDKDTKTITSNKKTVELVQYSHGSERLTFECPRFIEGHDILKCNVITIHFGNEGIYYVKDMSLKEEDENTVIFTWLIKIDVTKNVGNVKFAIAFECYDDGASEPSYTWDTKECTLINVAKTVRNSASVTGKYPDIIAATQSAIIQLREVTDRKLNKAGWEADKYLGTDADGNVIVKDMGSGVLSWNDLPDKPFGEEAGTATEILSYQEYTFEDASTDLGTEELVEGETYKVTWDGTEYTCVAVYIPESIIPAMVAIGNVYDFANGTNAAEVIDITKLPQNGEPFMIGYGTDSNGEHLMGLDLQQTGTNHNVGIVHDGIKIKKLDVKYIPDELYTKIDERIDDYINEALGGDY